MRLPVIAVLTLPYGSFDEGLIHGRAHSPLAWMWLLVRMLVANKG